MSNRTNVNSEDRAMMEEVKASTKVSSYIDNIYEAVTTGNLNAVKGNVPNYAPPGANQHGYSNESGGMSMFGGVFNASEQALTDEQMIANGQDPQQMQKIAQEAPKPGFRVTENQFRAIQKYPTLVEYLGSNNGEKLAQSMMTEVAAHMVTQIEKNSQLISDEARMCVSKRQNIHQFFQGKGWACQVTANGPFQGNEAIFYKQEQDKPFVLRSYGTRYEDVTPLFNVVHDYRTVGELEELGEDQNVVEV